MLQKTNHSKYIMTIIKLDTKYMIRVFKASYRNNWHTQILNTNLEHQGHLYFPPGQCLNHRIPDCGRCNGKDLTHLTIPGSHSDSRPELFLLMNKRKKNCQKTIIFILHKSNQSQVGFLRAFACLDFTSKGTNLIQ